MKTKTKRALLITLGCVVLVLLTWSAVWVRRNHPSDEERELVGTWLVVGGAPDGVFAGTFEFGPNHRFAIRTGRTDEPGYGARSEFIPDAMSGRWSRRGAYCELEFDVLFVAPSLWDRLLILVKDRQWFRDHSRDLTLDILYLDATSMELAMVAEHRSQVLRGVRVPPDFVSPQPPALPSSPAP